MDRSRVDSAKPRSKHGMTLLELVLALALSGLLLMAVSMALHIHWKAFDVRRSRVEEAQLARAILRSIADDLRSTIRFEPPDLSGLNLASVVSGALPTGASGTSGTGGNSSGNSSSGGGNSGNGASNGAGGSGGASSPSNGGGAGGTPAGSPSTGNPTSNLSPNQGSPITTGGQTGGNSGNATAAGNASGGSPSTGSGSGSGSGNTTSSGGNSSGNSTSGNSQGTTGETDSDAAAQSGPSVVVGLYGTSSQLQFDISRLPRVDQYQAVSSADGSAVEIPSDIKTVVYFLQSEDSAAADGSATGASVEASASGTGRGLMRAESDRAVSAWGEMNGSSQSLYGGAKVLAQEVTSLQFQYFDGTEWLPEWNSDDQSGLPLAIEVQLTIASPQTVTQSAGTGFVPSSLATGESTGKVYRMVVHLPVGGITAKAESTETTEAMDSGNTSGSNSSNSPTGSNNSSSPNNSSSSNNSGGSNNSGNPSNSNNTGSSSSSSNSGKSGGSQGSNGSKGSGGNNGSNSSKGLTPPATGGKKS